jgi:hypothetical protein
MELKPGIGIGNIKFGMTRNQVKDVLGEPDLAYNNDDDDEGDIVFDYKKRRLSLTFYKNYSYRFGYLRTINNDVNYNGSYILNEEIENVKKNVFGGIINDWEFENYELYQTYFNVDYWLELEVKYDIIVHLEMGVPFKNDDEYQWATLNVV